MAALNYTIEVLDTGDNGSGPYTMSLTQNANSVAGGTSKLTDTNSLGTENMLELIEHASRFAAGLNAAAQESSTDTLN